MANEVHVVVLSSGPAGPQGPTGPQGPAGEGVPVGGSAGQVLKKNSAADFDTAWAEDLQGDGSGGSAYLPVIDIEAAAMRGGNVSPATFVQSDTTSPVVHEDHMLFPGAGAANSAYAAQVSFRFPAEWVGQDIRARLVWGSTGTGDVEWRVAGRVIDSGEPVAGAFGALSSQVDTMASPDQQEETLPITVNFNRVPREGDRVVIDISRENGDALDTMTADAKLYLAAIAPAGRL